MPSTNNHHGPSLKRLHSKPIQEIKLSNATKFIVSFACLWTTVLLGCLEVVQQGERQPRTKEESLPKLKASPIDISFVNVSDGYQKHPHRGAKDEFGNWGYRHDEKALANHPPPFSRNMTDACSIRDHNSKMIREKISVALESQSSTDRPRAKILCIVYTTESNHATKIPVIRETWGPRCDGFMVASTKTDPKVNAVEIGHQGEEKYDNIWQKIRSVWSYVYDNYYNDYDWFHIGGEDMFVIPENLRLYVESEEIIQASQTKGGLQMPLYLGCQLAFEGNKDMMFNQGGGGYTLNKAALKALVVQGIPYFYSDALTFTEDVMIAKVFQKLGVYPYDTRDEKGAERYHPYSPGFHYDFRLPRGATHGKLWYAAYIIDDGTFKEGVDHCSEHSVSFHYIKVDLMYRLFALLYGLCPETGA
jgi:glycoprotein-N-acetylgalactosamine 3-beta-galactosyltransferase